MATTQKRRYASMDAAAEYAACSLAMIRKLIAHGDIPSYRVGRSVRVDLTELDRYMAGR